MNTANEQTGPPTPPEVPAKATRSGSSREQEWGTLRLSHDSALVWTERMLAALGRGNDARQWHTLIDKVFSPKTLALASQCLVRWEGVGLPDLDHPRLSRESHEVNGASRTCGNSSTGEPDAGNPPVRF